MSEGSDKGRTVLLAGCRGEALVFDIQGNWKTFRGIRSTVATVYRSLLIAECSPFGEEGFLPKHNKMSISFTIT